MKTIMKELSWVTCLRVEEDVKKGQTDTRWEEMSGVRGSQP